jgi:hypothetical protein
MGANRIETIDRQLLEKLGEYDSHINAAIKCLCIDILTPTHPDTPENKRQRNQLLQQNQTIEMELIKCFHLRQEVDLVLSLFLKEQAEEKALLKEEEEKHREYVQTVVNYNAAVMKEHERSALAMQGEEYYAYLRMKNEIENLITELNKKIHEVELLISEIEERIKRDKKIFLERYTEQARVHLSEEYGHKNNRVEVKHSGRDFYLSIEEILVAYHAVLKRTHETVTHGEMMSIDAVEENIRCGMEAFVKERMERTHGRPVDDEAVRSTTKLFLDPLLSMQRTELYDAFKVAFLEQQGLDNLSLIHQVLVGQREHVSAAENCLVSSVVSRPDSPVPENIQQLVKQSGAVVDFSKDKINNEPCQQVTLSVPENIQQLIKQSRAVVDFSKEKINSEPRKQVTLEVLAEKTLSAAPKTLAERAALARAKKAQASKNPSQQGDQSPSVSMQKSNRV